MTMNWISISCLRFFDLARRLSVCLSSRDFFFETIKYIEEPTLLISLLDTFTEFSPELKVSLKKHLQEAYAQAQLKLF